MVDNEILEVEDQEIDEPVGPTKAALQEQLEKNGLNYGAIGIGGTFIYLGLVAWILSYNGVDLGSMRPNEWGDFLAGIFGPLALFWVVMGFWQQGAELRNSRDALRLQAKELENSVVAQQDQANALYAQIESSRDIWEREQTTEFIMSQPSLRLQAKGSTGGIKNHRSHRFELHNVGERCSDIAIRFQDGDNADSPSTFTILANSEKLNLERLIDFSKEDRNIIVSVEYSDVMGRRHTRYFVIRTNSGSVSIVDENGSLNQPED